MLQVQEIDHPLDRFPVLYLHLPHVRKEEQLTEETRPLVRMARQQQVFEQGGVLEQLDILKGAGYAQRGDTVRRYVGDVAILKNEAASSWLVDAANQVEDGRLAGPIGTDDGEYFALAHSEADVVDGADAPEVDNEFLCLEERHRSRSDLM
jgi:hypothetical protein